MVQVISRVEVENAYHLKLWPHQIAMRSAPWIRTDCNLFFDISGFGAGKSFGIVQLVLALANRYWDKPVTIAVASDTITRVRKTILIDLLDQLALLGWAYSYQAHLGILTIGAMKFMFVATEQPELIFGYTVSAFLVDELDELKQEDALLCFRRVGERTRKPFPDGRPPFQAYFTTSNGYKGTYQIISNLAERKTPYFHVRGETKENQANDPSYYWNLWNIYNETERQAWLEGRFVNLTSGRVYYGYDESKNRLKAAPFPIESNDLIRVGQDFNTGFSRGCATVVRGGVIHVVKLWDFKQIGHAPKMIRQDFPPNVIKWYPDASGYEIVLGYAKEVKQYDILCRVGSINPSIVDRVFFVNKLFEMGRLVLWPDCGPLSMALKVRQYDDKGDPEKGKGPLAPDHWADCLEYVTWRIVQEDAEFKQLWEATRAERKQITDRVVV